MPWIENVSMKDIAAGRHNNAGTNSMLIQIVDPAVEFPAAEVKARELLN